MEIVKIEKDHEVPQHEVFSMMVQLAVHAFIAATGYGPTVTYVDANESYTGKFVEFVEYLWAKTFALADTFGLTVEGPRGNIAIGKAVQRTRDRMDTAKRKPSRPRP